MKSINLLCMSKDSMPLNPIKLFWAKQHGYFSSKQILNTTAINYSKSSIFYFENSCYKTGYLGGIFLLLAEHLKLNPSVHLSPLWSIVFGHRL